MLIVLTWLGSTGPSFAQATAATPLVRFDVQGTLGWAHIERGDLTSQDKWDHGVAHGAFGLGWYWTDHVKTEVEIQAEDTAQFYAFEQVQALPGYYYQSSFYRIQSAGLSLGQSYQFLRNAWVHPYAGGGVDLRWESTTRDVQPSQLWDAATMQFRQIQPGRTDGPATEAVVRAFALAGIKAYFAPRGFLRADIRVSVRDGIDAVVTRVGVGIDF